MSGEQEAKVGGEETAPEVWPRVVRLKHPIDFGKERIEELEFRRGKAGDAKGMAIGETIPADQLMLLASRMCNRPLKVIEMLDIDDAGEVMDIALVFFGKYLAAGKKPSR